MHVCTHACARLCVLRCGGQGTTFGVNVCLMSCDRVSLLFPAAYTRLAGPEAPGVSALSVSHPVGALGLQM